MAKTPEEASLKRAKLNRLSTVLTATAGVSFYFVCMILPLVGPSGAVAPHAKANFAAFLTLLVFSLVLGGLALWSRIQQRREGTAVRLWPMVALVLVEMGLLVALFAGALRA